MSTNPITSPLPDSDRDAVGQVLQATLVDLVDLHLIGKQLHWNVIGKNFRSVHLQLDELVVTARNAADEIAERAAALGVTPNGKAKTIASSSGVPDVPEGWLKEDQVVEAVVSSLAALIARLRKRIDETDKPDLVTQDMLIGITKQLEEAHWMWQAQQA